MNKKPKEVQIAHQIRTLTLYLKRLGYLQYCKMVQKVNYKNKNK